MSELLPYKVGDLAGLSEPATKVIECISAAIGTIYEPIKIKKKAKAEAFSKIEHAKADAEVELIKWQAETRIAHKEERRQRNINKIVGSTIRQLPEKVNDTKPEVDWITQFFEYSQDISNEEMQFLWSQILAGEFIKPGSFSLKTLNIVKMLNKDDAALFQNFCNFVWNDEYLFFENEEEFFRNKKLHWNKILHLETLGLINTNLSVFIYPEKSQTYRYKNNIYLFKNNFDKNISWSVLKLTSAGKELFRLCDQIVDEEYEQEVIKYLSSRQYHPIEITQI